MLHPRIAVLRRCNGLVQLGWDPGHAVVLRPPGPAEAVPALLRLLDGVRTRSEILSHAGELGFDAGTTRTLLDEMAAAGLLAREGTGSRLRTVRVHGRGPLSDALIDGLRRIGLRPSHSAPGHPATQRTVAATQRTAPPDLVVLADALVPDPALVAELMRRRIPHLQVRIRDGRGVIGPLVLPGATSCLRCADLHRCDHDPDWPHLCAQLLDRVGHLSPAGIAATAALALGEVETIAYGRDDQAPATLNSTLEVDLDSHHLEFRPWSVHPHCGCTDAADDGQEAAGTPLATEIPSADADPVALGNSREELL
ncbi:TOMM precursor leader peptide-binding protein [Nocardia sp. NBC_01388]|uniref:TOMM precursor leader peptide-binding protein n=1 Tax=Nocardia sp. NBC_01388 TaxID=2903596 RepID=UPI003244B9D6